MHTPAPPSLRNSAPPQPSMTSPSHNRLLLLVGLLVALSVLLWRLQTTTTTAPPTPRPATSPTHKTTSSTLPPLTAQTPPSLDPSLHIQDAYAAIPHRQTTFSAEASQLSEKQKRYLHQSFALLDQGVAFRVAALQALQRRHSPTPQLQRYQKLIRFFQETSAPSRLQTYHQTLTQALKRQHRFLQHASAQSLLAIKTHPDVRRSSAHLRRAYRMLMRLFPTESRHNRQAFFDHLCALDFI